MQDVKELHSIQISLASPEEILSWSHGEVTKPETINHKTLKAETDGLFCEKIFGPTKDWECKCGKYKKMRYRGTICDKCGVEVTSSKVRRERMGHISLACPVSHIWYFKGTPSRIGLILEISPRQLERVLYFAAYIVLDPGDTNLSKYQVLNEQEYQDAVAAYGKKAFKAQMGAEAIQYLLKELDLPKLEKALQKEIEEGSGQRKMRCIRRLEEVEAFLHSGNKPEWMILSVLPVIPPDLRPMVQLDGGRFATSDLNDLYRRVINRNNRLKRLLELGAPEVIIRDEKRMLQETVDALLANGRRGRAVSGPGNRPLKSLSDMLSGKEGRFRQNLLGKRVNFSGTTAMVIDPELKMYQCGLPKEMAAELYKPFIMHKLIKMGVASNLKAASKKVAKLAPEVWEVLGDVVKDHPILLHRFPTLNRLGIQAFEPILWDGRAIKISPLVCPSFNAKMNGDSLHCHLPLSEEAQLESRILMLSSRNILNPQNGKPLAVPSQDMVLGCYYLTFAEEKVPDSSQLHVYSGYNEVMLAYELHKVHLHDFIKVYIPKEEFPKGFLASKGGLVITTPGRLLFNHILPKELRAFYKQRDSIGLGIPIDNKQMTKLVNDCFIKLGNDETVTMLENIKKLGSHYATFSGISIGAYDLVIPPEKESILQKGEAQTEEIRNSFLLTKEEKERKTMSVWNQKDEEINRVIDTSIDKTNPLTIIVQSGARGTNYHIHKMTGMYGYSKDIRNRTIQLPAKNGLREGLSVLDFFNASHSRRIGIINVALQTADSGYLTRRLIDVAHDVMICEDDCDVETLDFDKEQARIAEQPQVKKTILGLKDSIVGGMVYKEVVDRRNGEVLLPKGEVLTAENLTVINRHLVESITVILPNADTSIETFNLNTTDAIEEYNHAMFYRLHTHFKGKALADDVVDRQGNLILTAGTIIDEKVADKILSLDIPVIRIRLDQMKGVEIRCIEENGQVIESLAERIAGRCPLEDVRNPLTHEIIAKKNEEITDEQAEEIQTFFDKLKVRSVLTCLSTQGVCAKCYGRDLARHHHVEVGEAVGIIAAQSIGEPGTQLTLRSYQPGDNTFAMDPVKGIDRILDLFEVRDPKNKAFLSPSTGTKLNEGHINPRDILEIIGIGEAKKYILEELQKIYHSHGIEINDKHFEVIIRQMCQKVRITDPGDSDWVWDELVNGNTFDKINAKLEAEGKKKAEGEEELLSITKASLTKESFMSAASFQNTVRVLTQAAIKGQKDPLLGLKENVIIGKLIPAGTGARKYQKTHYEIKKS